MLFLSLPHTLTLVGCVALSVVGVLLMRRFVPDEALKESREMASFLFSVVGLVYGIYLAFTIVVVWQQYEDAEEDATEEAVLLGTMFRDAEVYAPAVRERVHQLLRAYTRAVIDHEYATMADGRGASPVAQEAFHHLWRFYAHMDPDEKDAEEMTFHEQSISRLDDLASARQMRLLSSFASLPPVMWVLLVAGTIGTILLTYIHSAGNRLVQMLATAFLTAMLVYSVLLVAALEHPFGGEVAVSTEPYVSTLTTFDAWEHLRP